MTEDMFERVYALNVKVPYFLVAALAPLMAQRGKGAIVNLSTMAAEYGAPGMSLYGSSKAALNLLTKTWAAEYGPSGVRVNAVSPGRRARKARTRGGRGSSTWPLRRQRAVRRPRTRLQRPLSFWRRIEPVSFTAPHSPSTAGARPCEDGGRLERLKAGPAQSEHAAMPCAG